VKCHKAPGARLVDKVPGRNRYTDELHNMTVDITEIANSIKRYQESGEKGREQALKLSAADKLRHKAALSSVNRKVSALRKQVRQVMESRTMDAQAKRQRIDRLQREIGRLSADAVKKYATQDG